MRCENCNIGDLHYYDSVFDFQFPKFWRLKVLEFLFVCDYCGSFKHIINKGEGMV